MTITEILARNARLTPDAIALVEITPSKGLRKPFTWKEFDERANRVANMLIDRGIKKGDIVMHLMMNSISWLEAYFGILKTGAIAAPLNFRFISRQIKYCADIAEPKIMVLDQDFLERVDEIRPELKNVKKFIFVGEKTPQGMENYEEALAKASTAAPKIQLTGEDEAGLYFTSGTTGDPKATLLCHRSLEHTAVNENFSHRENRQDCFLLIQPLYHTGGKMHWFGSLIGGGRAVMTTGGERVTAKLILETIHKEKVTICMLLVPWLQDIVTALDKGDMKLSDYDMSSLRLVHSGAQPIPPVLVRRFLKYFPDIQYEENYGLTESSGPCMHLGLENLHKLGSFGYPRLNLDARVIDDKGNDVPAGTVGEIILRGANIMKCYYKNPEKTAETLRDGWLYTGDLVKQDEEGFISYVDRKKDLIISGGENIYPVDLESVLIGQPKVKDVAIIGVQDERYGEVVAAVVQPKEGYTVTEEEMKAYYEPMLPKYAWPRIILFGDVPRNPTGKIEKPKLRERYADVKWNPKGSK
ncbi:MAG: AMP-dependent synthetase [Chloroflexi bacterium RBG_13_51_52]|nr:MAG: AMP-dependent synthetase [Chloroflexi bacterium RBG_13_51_52]